MFPVALLSLQVVFSKIFDIRGMGVGGSFVSFFPRFLCLQLCNSHAESQEGGV